MKLSLIFENLLNEINSLDTSNFVLVKSLGGSTNAQLYKDTKTNQSWVVKFGNNIGQMYNEYLSNKIYSKFGVKVPLAFLGKINNQPCFIAEYLEGSEALGHHLNSKIKNEVSKGFLFDVLLANWDVVGSDVDLDNIRIKDGEVYRVDVGGSLLYRAQGGEKKYGEQPEEYDSLRDFSVNYFSAQIFQDIRYKDIAEQIRDVMKDFVVDNDVNWDSYKEWLQATIYDKEIKLPANKKKEILNGLLMRTKALYQKFN